MALRMLWWIFDYTGQLNVFFSNVREWRNGNFLQKLQKILVKLKKPDVLKTNGIMLEISACLNYRTFSLLLPLKSSYFMKESMNERLPANYFYLEWFLFYFEFVCRFEVCLCFSDFQTTGKIVHLKIERSAVRSNY